MLNESFVSIMMMWKEISSFYSGITGRCSKFLSAYDTVGLINNVLETAPADVGGVIPFSHTRTEVEELSQRRQLFQQFADGIHYEADEIIDNPFVDSLKNVIQDAYNLSPNNFRTQKNFLFWERGYSLEELIVDVLDTEDLKTSYQQLFDTLDNDMISQDLEVVFEEADYWRNQFEQLHKIREIQARYMDDYADSWNQLTADQKLIILNDYGKEVGRIIDERGMLEILFDHELVLKVDWDINDPKYDPTSTAYGYTYSSSRNGMIYINNDAISNKDIYSLEFLLKTVAHETRHQYQGQAKNNPETYEIPTTITDQWLNDYTIDYYERPWEIDARAFAALSPAF